MSLLILTYLVQLALIVHVLKTGRNMIWVFVLLFAPFIGGLAYFIVELLPDLLGTRGARKARRSLTNAIDPNRDLRAASQQHAVADTVQNTLVLANQHLERQQYPEAAELFARCLRGLYADDPDILFGLAKAQFGLEDYADVIATLDRLRATNPKARTADSHLLYARAQEESGALDAAKTEYEALGKYYPGPEPRCRLALILKAQGDAEGARRLFAGVVGESEVAGRHYNQVHREWVSLARRELTTHNEPATSR
jgi:hypothetical protein